MFVKRAISGVILVIIALLCFIFGNELLLGVSIFISVVGYLELCKATGVCGKDKKFCALEAVGIAGILAYYATLYFLPGQTIYMILPFIGVFMLSMFVYVGSFPKYVAEQVMANVFHFVYAPVMLSFIYLTRQLPGETGIYLVWLILISSWGSDTCAYLVGICIGKKKIFPVLSPKKSLEGCIGGVVGAGLLGFIYSFFFLKELLPEPQMPYLIMVICMIGAVMSQIGDLAASAIKRNHDIKDYGKLIPGHGGIMDRFDSVIVTAPMVYFLVRIMIG